jgi:hypothetical protein
MAPSPQCKRQRKTRAGRFAAPPAVVAILSLLFLALPVVAAPLPLLGDDPDAAMSFNAGPVRATAENVEAVHPAFRQARRVSVPAAPAQPHQVALNARNLASVAEGDVLFFRVHLRAGGGEGATARTQLFLQEVRHSFRAISHRSWDLSSEWHTVELEVTSRAAYRPGELQLAFFFGQQPQVVEVGGVQAWNLGGSPDPAELRRLREIVAVAEDFEGDFVAVPETRQSRGSLPAGWVEDSHWADVAVTYGPLREAPFAGAQSLRVAVERVERGRVQVVIPDVVVVPSHFMRLRFAVRSPTSGSVEVSLRQRGEPYRTYWTTTFHGRPEWAVVEALASVDSVDREAVLMFAFESPGVVEIDDLVAVYLTPEEALGDRDFSGNLLPSSSFPLGLSAPWAGGGNGMPTEAYQVDPEVRGPTGLPSLRLTPSPSDGRPMSQLTAPFEGRPGGIHTFSFWARAEETGKMVSIRVGPVSANLWRAPWQKEITISQDWERYYFSLELPPSPEGFYLARINSHSPGVCWVDGLTVEADSTAGEFKKTGPVEVAAVAMGPYGLLFEGATLRYRVAAWGDLQPGTRIAGTLRDLYGNEWELPPVAIDGATPLFQAEVEVPDLGQPPLGSYLIELRVLAANGQSLSRPAELLLHRVRRPRHWGEAAPQSPFGVHVFSSAREAIMAKALGFNWARTNYKFNWSRVEPRPGAWNWDGLDAEIAALRSANLEVLAYLGGVPQRASNASDDWTGSNVSWWRVTAAPREDALDGWEEYARRVLGRYGDQVRVFEIWNEPFLAGFFVEDVVQGRPVRAPASRLYQIAERVRKAANEAGFAGQLFWNVGAHYGDDERHFDAEAVLIGTSHYVDGYTMHRYSMAPKAFPEDRFAQDVAALREVHPKALEGRPLWNSEGGSGPSELFNLYRHSPPRQSSGQADAQADRLVRYVLSNFAAGIEKVFLYSFFEPDEWKPNYSYLHVDGQLSQTAPAISNLAWLLEGKRFEEMVALPGGIFGHVYEGGGETVVVLVSSGLERPRLSVPAGTEVIDLYGNPAPREGQVGGMVIFLRGANLGKADLSAMFR